MQLCRIIYCSLAALHISRDIFAHHQEHLNCIYSFQYCLLMSLPAGVMDEFKMSSTITNSIRQNSQYTSTIRPHILIINYQQIRNKTQTMFTNDKYERFVSNGHEPFIFIICKHCLGSQECTQLSNINWIIMKMTPRGRNMFSSNNQQDATW